MLPTLTLVLLWKFRLAGSSSLRLDDEHSITLSDRREDNSDVVGNMMGIRRGNWGKTGEASSNGY